MTPEEINKIIEEEVYCDRFEGTYDHGDAVARIMALHVARIEALEAALRQIVDAPAWGAPDRWEATPFEVRQLARAALTPESDK